VLPAPPPETTARARAGRPDDAGRGHRLLVVDDDPALVRALRIGLEARGYAIAIARSAEEGISAAALIDPEVIVLDLGLPDLDGLDVCRRVRQWSDVPILVLSALGAEDRKVLALDSGADDFITKPFGMAELEARLRVALRHRGARRRAEGSDELTEIVLGALEVDLARREVRVDARPVTLTAREFDLLSFLARNAGRVCTHRVLLEEVWGPGYGREIHYLRVYANRLRRKLGERHHAMLVTNPGVGYQLIDDDRGAR
jgi:two-component system KDP operon response regulator KdpE